jgi:diguanylate cyclase (GGDEF)-like protein
MSVSSRHGEGRLQRVLDTAGIGYWDWSPGADRLFVDSRLSSWLGARPTTMAAYRVLTQERQRRAEHVDLYRLGNRWIEERRSVGVDRHTIGACLDVTNQQLRHEALAWDAGHDPLTGLLTRRSFDRLLHQSLTEAGDGSAAVSLLMVDLDRFKAVNDQLGHESGDRVLAAVAHRFRTAVRRSDPIARWGGDEFATILGTDARGLRAGSVAERLLHVLRQPVQLEAGIWQVQASVGIAVHRPGEDSRALARRTDQALYAAKTAGGDRWRLDGWTL